MKLNNKLRIVGIFVLVLLIFQAIALDGSKTAKTVHAVAPVNVIFETDFTLDVDDVGALSILHAMADNGEVQILAESYDEVSVDAEDALDAINTWYGRGDIPIGLYSKPLASPDFGPYILPLAGMTHDINDNTVSSSLDLYQQVLSAQPDNSVTIISVGFLNNLYDLLIANPTLVAQKVNKLVIMGGLNGDDFNFVRHGLVSQTQYVLENWPNTVAVIDFGGNTLTGYALLSSPASNPVRQGYATWFGGQPQNRPSWDEVATLYAVRGLGNNFNEITSGTGSLSNGYSWNLHGGANARTYITSAISNSAMATIISDLMVATPAISPSGDPEVTGTIIGTTGSCCGHPRAEAVDDLTSTYFDAPSANGGWVGYDFGPGNEKVITQLGYYPRLGFSSRMNGGKFQGSNDASFSSPVTLHTIVGTPLETYTTVKITNSTAFRYVRYLAPNGGYGNIAEMDFYGHATTSPTNTPVPPTNTPVPPTSTPVLPTTTSVPPTTTPNGTDPEVTGAIIGTAGYTNGWGGGTRDVAVDGNTATFFDAPSADGAWVGYDFGSGNPKVITSLRYYPRSSFASRMIGGKFQGSNEANFSNAVTLYTISSTPPLAYTQVNISNSTAFRYVRYLAPDGGWGNIAEVDFYGHASGPLPTNTPVPSLLLRYNFDDGSGTVASDASGNGRIGTLIGFTNTSAGVGSFNSSEGWVTGGGLSFLDDGVRNYVQTNLALNSLANSDFTIEYEASYAGATGWTPAIGSNAGTCCNATVFLGINTNLTNNEVRLEGSSAAIGSQPWGAFSSTPHHVALVFANSTKVVELFVDGISVGTSTFSSANMNQTSTFRIGNSGHDTTEQWDGVIYAVAISKAKLGPGTFVLP